MLDAKKEHKKLTSLLSFVFFFSGFTALIYQVSWQRLLTVYYGVGSITITLIVSVYMLGLGLGALLGGYLSERIKNKIILYFFVELLIGCFGLISLPFLNFLGRYTAGSSYLISFLYMFLFLCIPTVLMGITLPLITKIFNRIIRNFLDTVSFLYFINTIGAAFGAIFSSYVVISFFGLDSAVYCAVIINLILAALILIARYIPSQEQEGYLAETVEDKDATFGRIAYLLVFITGFLAIGYEIAWFRVVGVLVKASPYAFSSVLFVYLSGIALGSFGMSKYLRKHRNIDRKSLFFLLQFLIGIFVIAIFTGYYYLTKYTQLDILTQISFNTNIHPHLKFFTEPDFSLNTTFFINLYRLLDVFFWSTVFVMIPTVFMGASFPLISSLALSQANREGKTIGMVYFFNIVGNVLGGVITGFLLLPLLSTEITLLIFSSIGIFSALFIKRFAGKQISIIQRIGLVFILLAFTAVFFFKKGELYKIIHSPPGGYATYLEEGIDGVAVIHKQGEKVINMINGLFHGGRPNYHYHYMAIEAVSFAQKTDNVLIIGYGAGSITEAVSKLNDVKKITIVELSNTSMKNLKKMSLFRELLADNRIELIIDDGRRYLLRNNNKFDLIMMDPIRTTTSYSNNIYSQQFFKLVNQHLTNSGVLMLWTETSCKQVLYKTVLSVFDNVRVYYNFALSSKTPLKKDNIRYRRHINSYSPEDQKHLAGLVDAKGIIYNGLPPYLGDQTYIEKVADRYPINKDWKPVCEYYIGKEIKESLFW